MADIEYKNGALCVDKLNVSDVETFSVENPEYIDVKIDSSGKILYGVKENGNFCASNIESPSIDKINNDIDEIREEVNGRPLINALILGDSYSQNGGSWIRPMINEFKSGSTWVSIAVGSATIKDNYNDRTAHPYSDRPISSINGNNKNTLGCQIVKLKRLLNGECRGVLSGISIQTDASTNGYITIFFSNSFNKTYDITAGQTKTDIANLIKNDNVDGFNIFSHPTLTSYFYIEAQDSNKTEVIRAESDVVTFSIEKIQDAETQLGETYQPNVIILEGGMNDSVDTSEKVNSYHAQLNKIVTNVYRKQTSNSEVELGNVTIKTPTEEVDRTCFAGAYRCVLEELLNLFPNAQYYITTCSPIGYRNGGNTSSNTYEKAEQQRLCADILTCNVIDWHRDGQINSIVNCASGSGTLEDPYIWAQKYGKYVDANDLLHPNARGGKKYGKLAALVIKETFLGIENF